MASRLRVSVGTIALASILLAALVAPVGATTIKGKGFYARFNWAVGDGALVIVDRVQSNSGRLNMSATGLFHNTDYVVVGRSVACDAPLANSNRMFRANFTSDSNGDASLTKAITLANVQVTSIWITAPGPHGPDVCSNAFNFEKWKGILGTHGQGALGIWDKEHVLSVVERRPHSSARVSVVFQGGNGSDQFSVVGSSTACGQPAGQGYLNIALENVQVSSYTAKTVPLSQAQLDALKSLRIRNVTEGTQVGCAPLSIIAILIGL